MAVIDSELILIENQATTASLESSIIDLGVGGATSNPLYLDVKLSQKLTSGSVDSIKVQSADTEEFGSPQDEYTININNATEQTVKACQLVQAFLPVKPKRYLRITVTGTSPEGGKIWAYASTDIQLK